MDSLKGILMLGVISSVLQNLICALRIQRKRIKFFFWHHFQYVWVDGQKVFSIVVHPTAIQPSCSVSSHRSVSFQLWF